MALASLNIWCVGLDVRPEVEAALRAELSADEAARFERLASPVACRRHAVARGTLRALLGSFTGQPPRSVAIETGPSGKPRLADADGLHFNVSHSGDLALICVSGRGPVGVDVESVRPVPSAGAIARRRFAPVEARFVEEGDPAEADRRFLLCWTRKEAVVKAIGTGLGVDLRGFTVPLTDSGGTVSTAAPSRHRAGRWLIAGVPVDEEHVAALALPASAAGESEGLDLEPARPRAERELDHCKEIEVPLPNARVAAKGTALP
jgi:4'-phosphopantetheinyl transferase